MKAGMRRVTGMRTGEGVDDRIRSISSTSSGGRRQLRAVFLEEMEHVQSEWVRVHHAGVLRNDFYTAVMYCDDELCRRRVGQWVDRVEAMGDEELEGGVPGLEYESLNDTLQS